LLVAAFTNLAVGLPLRGTRLWIAAIVFPTWKPIRECLADLQMETIILFCLSLSALLLARSRTGAGAAIGVAGAFKVYPWLVAGPFLLARWWRIVAGVVIGSLVALALSAISLPARHSIEFFFQILPRLGGISLSYENFSLLATLGRILLWARGDLPPAEALDSMYLEQLQSPRVLAWLLFLGMLGALALLGWKRRSYWSDLESGRKATALLALGACATVALIPTSWLSYQSLLVLPALVCVARVLPGDILSMILLGTSLAAGVLLWGYDDSFARHPGPFAAARTIIPYALAVVVLRSAPRAA
jgi:hypothetical protein